ncbi:MAG: hypothetical protein R3C99_18160 [Pirellulaceae bacterium]
MIRSVRHDLFLHRVTQLGRDEHVERLAELAEAVWMGWLVRSCDREFFLNGIARGRTHRVALAKKPGAVGEADKDKPTLIIYLPESNANGAAVVVCPGGGYGGLAMGHEGHEMAQWLNSFGVAAFICDYRHRGKGYGHPAPMQDAQRAIRTVRQGAKSLP